MTEITVMAASVNGKVVLWEVNPQHPGGEVFISGDGRSVQATLTPAVQKKLDAGELVKVVTVQPEPPASAEPVPGYDALNAAAVVELLATLTDEEKTAVLDYETTHKNRATVLKALQ
jgi:hypothetical protein